MKFRKKPVVIEAFAFELDTAGNPLHWGAVCRDPDGGPFYIDTLEGRMTVTPGDYIITGVKGETYPCKPDIFEATYEVVREDEATRG